MSKLLSIGLITTIASVNLNGYAVQEEKGKGYLFSYEEERSLRIDLESSKLFTAALQKQNQLDEQLLQMCQQQEQSHEKADWWHEELFFFAGAAVSGFVAYGLIKALK